jgi:hypothetical protein
MALVGIMSANELLTGDVRLVALAIGGIVLAAVVVTV